VRRRSRYNSSDYTAAIEGLNSSFKRFKAIEDQSGQHRCASELVRAYLDRIEFDEYVQKNPDEMKHHSEQAEHWLARLVENSDNRSSYRASLHQARLEILRGDPEIGLELLREAKNASRQTKKLMRAIPILEASAYLRLNEFEKAYGSITRNALKNITLHSDPKRNGIFDPVLEAECCLLLVRTCAALNSFRDAEHYLDAWNQLGRSIENYYLHELARRACAAIKIRKPFKVPYDFEVFVGNSATVKKTLIERSDEFLEWLVDSVRARYPKISKRQLAAIYGRDPANFSRRFDSGEKREPRNRKKQT
jgi:tetratricopeptide (TPR) repeat protein